MPLIIALCPPYFAFDLWQHWATGCTLTLAIEAGMLLYLGLSGGHNRERIIAAVIVGIAAASSLALTFWLVVQNVVHAYSLTLCMGRYNPLQPVSQVAVEVNAQAVAAGTFGAVVALWGTGTLVTLTSLLPTRRQRRTTGPAVA